MIDFIVWTFTATANNVYIQYTIPALGIFIGLTLLVDWVLAVDKVIPFFQKYTENTYAVVYPMVFYTCMSGISFMFGFEPNAVSEYWIGAMVITSWISLVFLMGWGIYQVLSKVREAVLKRK